MHAETFTTTSFVSEDQALAIADDMVTGWLSVMRKYWRVTVSYDTHMLYAVSQNYFVCVRLLVYEAV